MSLDAGEIGQNVEKTIILESCGPDLFSITDIQLRSNSNDFSVQFVGAGELPIEIGGAQLDRRPPEVPTVDNSHLHPFIE